MPNPRRRRFSVQNEVDNRESAKPQHLNSPIAPQKNDQDVTSKSKSKAHPSNTKPVIGPHFIVDSESSMSIVPARKSSNSTLDKHVGVTSSSINSLNKDSTDMLLTDTAVTITKQISADLSINDPQKSATRRNKLPRQHRMKVRSPSVRPTETMHYINRGTEIIKCTNLETRSTGTDPVISPTNVEAFTTNICNNIMVTDEEDRQSSHSNDDICRICHGDEGLNLEQGQLISACACRGTVGRVHVKCLERWLTESGKSRCELCSTRYATKRVHRYGVPKALVMWILSQNAKQLLVDSLGIMLMSPLAVLAAWLSGRTLAGLMVENHIHITPWPQASTFVLACLTLLLVDSLGIMLMSPLAVLAAWLSGRTLAGLMVENHIHITPWPQASTFVLACLTLVCYYCWIVSAATRHALGWWIWYRSQYEVRLELQENDH